jgi:hypothetical protein
MSACLSGTSLAGAANRRRRRQDYEGRTVISHSILAYAGTEYDRAN